MLLEKHVLIFGTFLIHVPGFLAVLSVPQQPCRSPCIRNALFKEYQKDFVLRGHVIATFRVPSPLYCTYKCIEEPRCKSINCENITSNKPTILCELNYETKTTKPAFYVRRTGHTYHDAIGPGSGWCDSVCPSPYNTLLCPPGFSGAGCQTPMKSCKDWLNHGFSKDGIYHVVLESHKTFPVYCDQTTDGGGWAVIQRREDGTVDFYRGWNEYKTGFGDLNAEFWLGNDLIHILTASGETELRVELETFAGHEAYAKYNSFNISNEESNYTLSASGYNGTAGDSLGLESGNTVMNTINNQMAFSTWDRDHDQHSGNGSCALENKGAWWFNSCYWSHLNGPYKGQGEIYGINWYSFVVSNYESLKKCSMKIRPAA
ncbi:fibrinogen-like protein A [Actinia tenebrosa]|uniref:Fibrinogen-like protein A n=1 Tax=Actinia tenebrosa TaxID=6105 RepID=A0A6P8J5Q2_ACTTE|nr:fibrinogen-like protein A [Actinia tenebrosa]XP_031572751.1 fibrinogen-like protein A [Actinia tenebrosa]